MGNFTYLKNLLANKKRGLNRLLVCLDSKIQLACFLFIILFLSFKSTAQNNFSLQSQQFYKVISFGEKIDFGDIDSSISWTVSNSQNNINITLRGNEINDYVFDETGEYDIHFQENKKHDDECTHPMFTERFRIKVEPVKLLFDFSKIQFSEKLEKGRNYNDLIITVPVQIVTKNTSITKLSAPGMSVAGLEVSLTAQPVEKEIILTNKVQLLKYKVSGMINRETYLMFDFYDFNNQVQTYNLRQIIK
ncbi:hypothetical protein [[Flexibacter] sp. ATCC 35103]|uniref:hypothetical protein n=1 Tax=[Flexibacter] sp. ATCC 35103 TaxID=1937528 RepID=UPI0009D083BA|nr:hypothetical protein [[Flexibacter] sp. ATCC 35103]OMQ10299.1 hypothetical protein BXU01_13505 [[Flexibacter] sp. ATCC 35103]